MQDTKTMDVSNNKQYTYILTRALIEFQIGFDLEGRPW